MTIPARFRQPAIQFFLVVLLLLPACRDGEGTTPVERPYRVGYMICDGLEETKARFEALTQYLSTEVGAEFEAVYIDTYDVPEAYEQGKLDFTHSNSLLYVIMREEGGLLPLAGEKRGKLGFMSAGGIAVRSDSSCKTLTDLKGKRFVFGPNLAPTGFMSQYELLMDAGIDPELDLGYYGIPWGSYKHEKVIYNIWFGAYDAGAVPLLDLDLMKRTGRIDEGDLRILAVNDPIPYCVFGVSPTVPKGISDRVRSVLMNIDEDTTVPLGGETVRVLKAALVEGFVPIEDSDFDRVREMARKTNMPPYQAF